MHEQISRHAHYLDMLCRGSEAFTRRGKRAGRRRRAGDIEEVRRYQRIEDRASEVPWPITLGSRMKSLLSEQTGLSIVPFNARSSISPQEGQQRRPSRDTLVLNRAAPQQCLRQ